MKDRYPFIYLERGKLEVDDSAVKWIDCNCNIVRIPIATIATILLGPGTSVTHEAIKVLASANTTVCWVGEDSLMFYAVGESPTAKTSNFRAQMKKASSDKTRTEVARRMFSKRFPDEDISNLSINQLMGKEGKRVKALYAAYADKYKVGWKGRSYSPGSFELSDTTNKIITGCNAALYGLISSVIYSMGYSPHVGFIHTGSPLPFVYDIADLYKEELSIELAFSLTYNLRGVYDRNIVLDEFRKKVLNLKLLEKVSSDIQYVLGE